MADVLASFADALIGGVIVISMVYAKRAVTRMRRQRRFANRRFIRQYRADHPQNEISEARNQPEETMSADRVVPTNYETQA